MCLFTAFTCSLWILEIDWQNAVNGVVPYYTVIPSDNLMTELWFTSCTWAYYTSCLISQQLMAPYTGLRDPILCRSVGPWLAVIREMLRWLEVILTSFYVQYPYTLLKSDVTRRDHVSVVMDPMNVGSRIVNFIVNFIRDGTVFA